MQRQTAVELDQLYSRACESLASAPHDPAGANAQAVLWLHTAAILGVLVGHVLTRAWREHPDVFPSTSGATDPHEYLLPAETIEKTRASLSSVKNSIDELRAREPRDAELLRGLAEVERRMAELSAYLDQVSQA